MKTMSKNLIGFFFVMPAGVIFSLALFEVIKRFLLINPINIVFISGIIFYFLLRYLVKWIGYDFVDVGEVLVHELVHGFFSLLFLGDVKSLSVYPKKGGQVSVSRSNFLVELSPYCFPIIAIVVSGIKPFFIKSAGIYIVFITGFFLGQHLAALFKDFHLGQSDILNNGIVFSFSVVLFLNVFFVGIMMVILGDGYSAVPLFLNEAFEISKKCIYLILHFDYAGNWSKLHELIGKLFSIL
ncbi:MAG: hypothetical protein D6734_12615 [Candidatus Schekmanbacteria bacterium]|nr:MAG: hypothetical protein D6734_12615 [Candidatus Schekmanbacteria bacterium]